LLKAGKTSAPPLWLPKSTVLVEELEKLAKETEFAAGYVRVRMPHLTMEKMYKTSGHLPYYAESMFPKMEIEWWPCASTEHRADRRKIEARIAELEKQLADRASKTGG
jgi:threonyl-tRNA synthetase